MQGGCIDPANDCLSSGGRVTTRPTRRPRAGTNPRHRRTAVTPPDSGRPLPGRTESLDQPERGPVPAAHPPAPATATEPLPLVPKLTDGPHADNVT